MNGSFSQSSSLPPTTTVQEDILSAGQQKVGLIWEYTQAFIALTVVSVTMATGVYVVFAGKSGDQIPNIIATAFGIVVGFYFSRNNHGATNGAGNKHGKI